MRILFTGGGTGGHFFPIIAVIRELRRIAEEEQILNVEIFYLGPDGFGEELLQQEDVAHWRIGSGKMRRYASLQNVFDIVKTLGGIVQALWKVFLVMPDVVFSKGGYGALPAVVASIIFRIPLIIHESDSVAGLVNRFSGRFAKRIGIAFSSAERDFPKNKTALVGIPIRKRIFGGNRAQAKENFEVFSDLPVIGIIGASQGSEHINEVVLDILKELTDEFEVIHQTGARHLEEIKGEAGVTLEFGHKERYHPIGFLDEQSMREFYSASDVIVSRAGASSIFEIAGWGKPSLLIPLENSAQNHQLKNAYDYAAVGAAHILEESNLTPHILFAEIQRIASNTQFMLRMSEAAQRFSRIDAAEVIAREILQLGLHNKVGQ